MTQPHFPTLLAQMKLVGLIFEKEPSGHNNDGCVIPLIFIVGFVGLVGWGTFSTWHKGSAAVTSEKQQVTTITPEGTLPQGQNVSQAQNPRILKTLESVSLPCTVIVTEEFSLMNSAGKETSIPVGTSIRVLSRKKLGSLETQIKGATYVGNESRLAGKVKQP